MLDYQAQQHMHVQLWSLDAVDGLQDVVLHHGELRGTAAERQITCTTVILRLSFGRAIANTASCLLQVVTSRKGPS